MKKTLLLLTLFTISTLNAQMQLLSSVDQSDIGNGSWQNNQGYNYEYDANNNLISTTSYSWNGGVWSKFNKETYTYNSNGNVLIYSDKEYDTNTNAFVDNYRSTNIYDVNNNIIELIEEVWDGSQWQNEFKLDFTYAGSNFDFVIGQTWNGNAWVDQGRFTFTYNNNRLEQFDSEVWDNGAWIESGRTVLTYNANDFIISTVYENWDGNAYVEEESYDYSIDSNGNRLSETETYDSQTTITNYTYDNTQLMSAFANPFADKNGLDYITEDFPYFNKILSEEQNGNTARTIHNYDSALVLSIDSVEDVNGFSIYPNPVKNVLNIKTLKTIEAVEVYNMLGRRVMTSNSTKINVEQLSGGIYTVKVIDNLGNKTVKKIIKQ